MDNNTKKPPKYDTKLQKYNSMNAGETFLGGFTESQIKFYNDSIKLKPKK